MGVAKRILARWGKRAGEDRAYRVCNLCGGAGCGECLLIGFAQVEPGALERIVAERGPELVAAGLATADELGIEAERAPAPAAPPAGQMTFGW